MSILGDLRSLIRTREVAAPVVYFCAGCGCNFRSDEAHDFIDCNARRSGRRREEVREAKRMAAALAGGKP